MKLETSYRDIEKTDAIDAHIAAAVDSAVGRFGDRVTRVEVHVGDVNKGKGGPDDKRCMMEARPAGEKPVAVEAVGDDLYRVITDASGKLERVVGKKLDR
jgi:ribosome-associated translation inhibitor RaiA